MFDIGWTELLVVATVAIIVVGPKDLPRMLRTFGQTVGKLRRMANEFQSQFNDAIREAERQADLGELKDTLNDVKDFNPVADIKNQIEEPMSDVKSAIQSTVDDANTALDEAPIAATDDPTKSPKPVSEAPSAAPTSEVPPVETAEAEARK